MAADAPRIVVVPTYQEREMLPRFLQAFEGSGFHALVVDDGSPDGTGEWAEEYARGQPWLHVLRREGKGRARRRLPCRVRVVPEAPVRDCGPDGL